MCQFFLKALYTVYTSVSQHGAHGPPVGYSKFSGGNSIVRGQWKKKGLYHLCYL